MLEPPPSRIFEDVSVDLFSYNGNSYLVYVDRLSGWPTISEFVKRDPTSNDIISQLILQFSNLGVPTRLRSDGGPQFVSRNFNDFAQRWGITLQQSTPYYAQSNGHAEAAVKAMKALLAKTSRNGRIETEGFQRGLLEWRNTPRSHGKSPAEIVFGHQLRSFLPAHRSTFAKQWRDDIEQRESIGDKAQEQARVYYDAHAHPLKPIPIGSSVRIQDPKTRRWDRRGIIVSAGKHRDYRGKLPSGSILWRNRRFVREDFPAPNADAKPETRKTDVADNIKKPVPRTRRRVTFEDTIPRRSTRKTNP